MSEIDLNSELLFREIKQRLDNPSFVRHFRKRRQNRGFDRHRRLHAANQREKQRELNFRSCRITQLLNISDIEKTTVLSGFLYIGDNIDQRNADIQLQLFNLRWDSTDINCTF